MTTQRYKYSKLPRLPDRTPQSQESLSRLGVGSTMATMAKLGTLADVLTIEEQAYCPPTYHGFAQIIYDENEFPGKYHRRSLKNLCLATIPKTDDSPFVLIRV